MYGILNHNTTDDKLVSIQKEKVVFIQLIYLSLRLVVSKSLLLYLVLIHLPDKPMGAVSAFTDRNLSTANRTCLLRILSNVIVLLLLDSL